MYACIHAVYVHNLQNKLLQSSNMGEVSLNRFLGLLGMRYCKMYYDHILPYVLLKALPPVCMKYTARDESRVANIA